MNSVERFMLSFAFVWSFIDWAHAMWVILK
jgi:hypothetical protein